MPKTKKKSGNMQYKMDILDLMDENSDLKRDLVRSQNTNIALVITVILMLIAFWGTNARY